MILCFSDDRIYRVRTTHSRPGYSLRVRVWQHRGEYNILSCFILFFIVISYQTLSCQKGASVNLMWLLSEMIKWPRKVCHFVVTYHDVQYLKYLNICPDLYSTKHVVNQTLWHRLQRNLTCRYVLVLGTWSVELVCALTIEVGISASVRTVSTEIIRCSKREYYCECSD